MMHILGKWLLVALAVMLAAYLGAGDIGSVFLHRAYRGRAFGCCQCHHQADIGRSYFADHNSHARSFSHSLSTGSFSGARFVRERIFRERILGRCFGRAYSIGSELSRRESLLNND